MFTQLKQNFCSSNPQQTDVHIHALLKDWVTRNFSVNHFVKNIYPQIHPSIKPTNQTNVLNCSKGQRLHWELPPQQCVRKQRKLSKLILFSQSTVGRISHETSRITLGSLCTNQFAQRQSYCTRSRGERFLCTPQFYIRLDAEIAGSCVVLLALFDSDVWDLSDSLISCEQQQWRPRRCRRAWL